MRARTDVVEINDEATSRDAPYLFGGEGDFSRVSGDMEGNGSCPPFDSLFFSALIDSDHLSEVHPSGWLILTALPIQLP